MAPHHNVPFPWPNNECNCSLKLVMREICPSPCSRHHLLQHPSPTSPQGRGQRTGLVPQPPHPFSPHRALRELWRAVPHPPLHQHTPGQGATASQVFSAGLGPRASPSHEGDVGAWRRNVRKEQLEKTTGGSTAGIVTHGGK